MQMGFLPWRGTFILVPAKGISLEGYQPAEQICENGLPFIRLPRPLGLTLLKKKIWVKLNFEFKKKISLIVYLWNFKSYFKKN